MHSPRLAITTVLVLLAFGAAASSAVGATSRLVPSVPWLPASTQPAAPPRPTPAIQPSRSAGALPNTGFPVWFELLLAGILLCAGAAIRGRAGRGGPVRLEPALAGRR